MKKHFIMSFFILMLIGLMFSGCSSRPSENSTVLNSSNSESYSPENSTPQSDQNKLNINESTNSQQASGQSQSDTGKKGPNPMIIDQNKTYTAILHTEAGNIEIALNVKDTPITVNNFVTLAKKNFYDNTIFHRAIKGFMIQGGDPKGDGTGGPGYRFDDEAFNGEYSRGTLAMANAGPNTNGSQFFIMHQDYPLPKNYVIFGKVTKGIEAVDKIAEAEVIESASGEMSKPVNPIKINSIEIVEK